MGKIAFDLESCQMAGDELAPRPICMSMSRRAGAEDVETVLVKKGDPEWAEAIDYLLNGEEDIVAHSACFDLTVLAMHEPGAMSRIFALLRDEKVHCTVVREKLIALGTDGQLKFWTAPDGTVSPARYSLAALEKRVLGVDRRESKDGDESWRLHFEQLEHIPLTRWPAEAIEYVEQDARSCLFLFENQQMRDVDNQLLCTEPLHVAADFCLRLMSCEGWRIDPARKAKIEELVAKELDLANYSQMISAGILRPGTPSRPHARGIRNPDGSIRMTQGKKPSLSKLKLESHVEEICKSTGQDFRLTPSEKHVSTAWADIEDLIPDSVILQEYERYNEVQKLATTELPRMGDGTRRVHPMFDVLKETGRTSSYQEKSLPGVFSCNIQNVDPRARPCYVSDEGCLLLSVDYSALELVSLAQTCVTLFGESRLADVLKAGRDPHAYLGAQICYMMDGRGRALLDADLGEMDDVSVVFETWKKSEDQERRALFKKYRTLAKPTGLGYPGGLGARKFRRFAQAAYGVRCTQDEAEALKRIWANSFPEIPRYHQYVAACCEYATDLYEYKSPLGMLRRGASYCAACNGMALQTPSAEGAKLALFEVCRACYDETIGSPLLGCAALAFIHDEIILQVSDDLDRANECADALSSIMRDAMAKIMVDVPVRVEARLMRRWYKEADPVRDSKGRLVPWEPAEE